MGVDLRQVLAAMLTLTMFAMLGNMVKRDYIDPVQGNLPESVGIVKFLGRNMADNGLANLAKKNAKLWLEDAEKLKPCWTASSFAELEHHDGFVTFSLTNGPELHVSQIADAVVVARYLRATLIVPDIRGSKLGDERKFEEVYDIEKFTDSLKGVVRVLRSIPESVSFQSFEVVRVPNRVTEDHIVEHIEPIFHKQGKIRLVTYFPSVDMTKMATKSGSDSVACLAMFGTLQLQPELNHVVDSMIDQLRTLGGMAGGRFIAVDLMTEALDKEGCTTQTKTCYNAHEIAIFLRKLGYNKDTVIYLTQPGWHNKLAILKDIFPKTYTKQEVMVAVDKTKYIASKDSEIDRIVDFYICSYSDMFVPAVPGLFYANVAGSRIAAGRIQIVVPAEIQGSSAPVTNHLSPFVAKKNHMAYSCLC